ncbi:MAG: hypothetical protein EA365_07820 [Gloeocapsa sp. DLM2.Bin57]|nr:MAG: hypothetical protein EA365_07820 [Gloeocapsa sp. DLM2.Bin57]
MLYLLIIWLILLPICLFIGLFVLNLGHDQAFTPGGDRFIVAIWLGIVLLSISNFAIALILPLSPWVGLLVALIWLIVAQLSTNTWQDFRQLQRFLTPVILVQGLALTIATAAFSSQQVIWFDSGLYHVGSIYWLAKYGVVTGIGLIHSRFGFTSSWFGFTAPLLPNALGDNIGAVSNGFIFLIFFFWGLIGLNQALSQNGKIADWFAVIFVCLISFIYLADNNNGFSVISFSQDIPIAFLIGIVAWSMLIVVNSINSQWIPLILASGAFSIKLTAIPLLGLVLLFYVWRTKKIVVAIALTIILLLPNTLVSLRTSGCPLYPSSVLCLNLPWTVAQETIAAEVNMIGNIDHIDFEGSEVNPLVKIVQQRYKWLTRSKQMLITFVSYLISVGLGFYLLLFSKKTEINWVIFLGLSGTTFIMSLSPLFRFGVGYLMMIPALFTANYLLNLKFRLSQPQKYLRLVLVFLIFILIIRGWDNLNNRLLLPAKLPSFPLVKGQVNDVEYYYPDNFKIQCWQRQLPCATLPIQRDIQLRNPEKGIKAGFIWKTPPSQ